VSAQGDAGYFATGANAKCDLTHPGAILLRDFLSPPNSLRPRPHRAPELRTAREEIVRGKRGIPSDTAWLLAGVFGTTPEFWINLQSQHDLARNCPSKPVGRLGNAN
jgi:addiction module HigA family antidote